MVLNRGKQGCNWEANSKSQRIKAAVGKTSCFIQFVLPFLTFEWGKWLISMLSLWHATLLVCKVPSHLIAFLWSSQLYEMQIFKQHFYRWGNGNSEKYGIFKVTQLVISKEGSAYELCLGSFTELGVVPSWPPKMCMDTFIVFKAPKVPHWKVATKAMYHS